MNHTVFETKRLLIRRATVADAGMYVALWNDPRVMAHVGFPEGLGVDESEMTRRIRDKPDADYEQFLVVTRKSDGRARATH